MFDLTLSPANNEIFIKPGQNYLLAFQITNNSSTSLILSSSVESWQPSGSQGEVNYHNTFMDPSISFSLNNADLKLGENFVLHPRENKQLVLKIMVSPLSNHQDYFYTFFVHQPADKFTGQLGGKIGAQLIISTQDKQTESLVIKKFSATPVIKDTFIKPINFHGYIYNNSSQFNKIAGKLTITKNDLLIEEFTLSPDTVLGGYSRLIRCADKNTEIIPCALKPPLWPGFYQATLSLNLPQSPSATLNFFVFPYLILIILGILFGFFFFFYRRLGRRQNSNRHSIGTT
ncbi:MAG TPA: hypothetical protein PK131_01970 [Candidatus Woesebacteria bacterium]|nr:hypothetical protein [Candidatus Woesebacteria bacterium]HRS22802.1 hypothetical protein [Candidatus Woesebacteria bacterium]HRT40283.1 hypothetical protein [Candidatus Woesebacteria bacterium]